jgi:hypothetical protein
MSAYFSFRSTVKDPESTALPCHCERNAFIHFSGKICDFEIHDLLAHTFLFMGAKLTGRLFPADWEMNLLHILG